MKNLMFDLGGVIMEIERRRAVDALKAIGCDTAKSVLQLSVADIMKRADLEEETVVDVQRILKAEFEENV